MKLTDYPKEAACHNTFWSSGVRKVQWLLTEPVHGNPPMSTLPYTLFGKGDRSSVASYMAARTGCEQVCLNIHLELRDHILQPTS